MALEHWAFLYVAPGLTPDTATTVIDNGSCRTVLVGMEEPADGVEVAARLVDAGAQLIELCGAFGPVWSAKIIEATGGRVPIGAVGYGPEAVDQVHALFAD